MAVDLRRIPWVRRLAADYAQQFSALAAFFAGDPAAPDAWRRAIAGARHVRPRQAMVAIVAEQQERRGAPAPARAAAAQLADSQTVAIVTGQQAGLFGGPLYTLLKAVAALRLAADVTREHGIRAIPVFWIDSEDHDWEEISTCGLLDADLAWHPVSIARPARAGEVPVAFLRLDASVEHALQDLEATLAKTEFTRDLLDGLRAAFRPEVGIAEAFACWLETLLGPRGLVVFDGADPAAKACARPVFERELSSAGRTNDLAQLAGRDLIARGYHAQVTPQADGTALFHLDEGREPIRRLGDGFIIGSTKRTTQEVMAEVAAAPAHFSPNVLLRPVVQDSLFPTICYVAGPNELAYLAQLKAVYAHFGVPMPLISPRPSLTLVDAPAARFLTKHDVPLETLQPQDEAALNRLLVAQLPATVEQSLDEALQSVRDRMAAVVGAVQAIDPTLEGTARSTLGRMEHDLGTLRAKIIQAAKRRHDVLHRQFIHTRAQAFPAGHPQERSVGFVYFLNQYGPALIDRLIEALPLDPGQHWILTI